MRKRTLPLGHEMGRRPRLGTSSFFLKHYWAVTEQIARAIAAFGTAACVRAAAEVLGMGEGEPMGVGEGCGGGFCAQSLGGLAP